MELCPIALQIYGGNKRRRCPALRFHGDEAECGVVAEAPTPLKPLLEKAIGSGTGCDTIATVLVDGYGQQLADMDDALRIEVVRGVLNHEVPVVHKTGEVTL